MLLLDFITWMKQNGDPDITESNAASVLETYAADYAKLYLPYNTYTEDGTLKRYDAAAEESLRTEKIEAYKEANKEAQIDPETGEEVRDPDTDEII